MQTLPRVRVTAVCQFPVQNSEGQSYAEIG